MGLNRTDEFRQDAVRIALTGGPTPRSLTIWVSGCQNVGAEQMDYSASRHICAVKRGFRAGQEGAGHPQKTTVFFASLKL